jgi:hypothetical protein
LGGVRSHRTSFEQEWTNEDVTGISGFFGLDWLALLAGIRICRTG